MEWFNEPSEWQGDASELHVTTEAGTDFWRTTHYGFVRDSGHLYGERRAGDFVAEVLVRGDYQAQYDQAGLMVRLDERTWLKCGIELVDGVHQASVVVTRDYSDWSVVPLPDFDGEVRLRIERDGDALTVRYESATNDWTMMRLAYFPAEVEVLVGLYCASPDGQGFEAIFRGFSLGEVE